MFALAQIHAMTSAPAPQQGRRAKGRADGRSSGGSAAVDEAPSCWTATLANSPPEQSRRDVDKLLAAQRVKLLAEGEATGPQLTAVGCLDLGHRGKLVKAPQGNVRAMKRNEWEAERL